MADNSTLNPGAGGDSIRDKDRAGVKTQIVGLDLGIGTGSESLMSGSMPVTDNSGSLTVDAPVGTPVFVRLSDGSSAIATLPVSIASLPGQAADNAAALPGALYVVAGWDGTNVQALSTDSSGLLQVDVATAPTTAVTGPLTDAQLRASAVPVDTELPAAAALADNTANPTVPGTGAFAMVWDGATWDRATQPLTDTQLRASAVPVSLAANQSVNQAQVAGTATSVNSGNKDAGTQRVTLATDQVQLTNALKVDGSAVTQPVSGTVTASNTTGNIAHDSADSGNPVKIGSRARTADVTAVAQDDRADSVSTILGKQVILPYALPGLLTKGTANSTGTSDTSVISAPGAGITLYITSLVITNAHATVGTKVQIKSGTTSTGYPRVFAAANGGGAALTFPSPLKLAANEALQFANVTTGADVDVSAVGYTAAE